MKICRVAHTSFFILHHWKETLASLCAKGHDLTIVCPHDPKAREYCHSIGARYVSIPIEREPRPIRDLIALIRLTLFFLFNRFEIVHSATPKAGLLVSLSCWITRQKAIHSFTGHPWVERQGIGRIIPKWADWLICQLNSRNLVDSHSELEFMVAEKLGSRSRLKVLGSGSISGINPKRFQPLPAEIKTQRRKEAGIVSTQCVFGYVGRMVIDKGLVETLDAFQILRQTSPESQLVLIGPEETDRAPLDSLTRSRLINDPGVLWVGYKSDIENWLPLLDVLILASYRESFGLVILEAAAAGVPCIGTRITGIVDAIVEGKTGWLVPAKDHTQLAETMTYVHRHPEVVRVYSLQARQRVLEQFNQDTMTELVLNEYQSLRGAAPKP